MMMIPPAYLQFGLTPVLEFIDCASGRKVSPPPFAWPLIHGHPGNLNAVLEEVSNPHVVSRLVRVKVAAHCAAWMKFRGLSPYMSRAFVAESNGQWHVAVKRTTEYGAYNNFTSSGGRDSVSGQCH